MAAKFRDLNDDSDIDPPPPLTDGEISSFSRNWSLACDQKLLSGLRAFSGSIVQQTDQINSQIADLIYDGQRKCFKVMNVVNDLQMLPNSQFIENRVYEEPDSEPEVAEAESSSVRQVIDVMPKITESLTRGLKFIDNSFPHLTRPPDPLPDESDDDDLQLREQVKATIKTNSICSLSLPTIIGSDNFNESFYEVIKKATPTSPVVPADYDFVDSTPKTFETVVEGQEMDESAEYDSENGSRFLQDMLDSDSDEDFKPIPSKDLLNIFNQSPQLTTASTPVDVGDAKKNDSKAALFQLSSDSDEEQGDIFAPKPEVNPSLDNSASKPLSFKAELERKLGQKLTSVKTSENRVNDQSNAKSFAQLNGRIEGEVKSSFRKDSQSVRSSTLFESDDSDSEEDFGDLFKRAAPDNDKYQEPKVTQFRNPPGSINHVDHETKANAIEEKKPLKNHQGFERENFKHQSEDVSVKQVEEKMKSNQKANERGNEGNGIAKSSRGLFSPSSSSEEEDEVPRPSFSPSTAKASSSSSSFLPSFNKQPVVSERNSINRSSLDQLQPIKQTALSVTNRPSSSASSSASSVNHTIVTTSRLKQKDSKKFTKKKASLFDDSSSSDDDEDDLFKPKARLTPGNRNKPSSSNNKPAGTIVEKRKTTIESVAGESKKHPVTQEDKMGGLISSVFGPDNSIHQPAVFRVNNNHDILNSLESSNASSSKVKELKSKKIESLFEDVDPDNDPLFVTAKSARQTTATQTSILEKVNNSQETDKVSSTKLGTKAKIPLSTRVGNLANVTNSVSSSSSMKQDSNRDELTTNSNSEGLMIPSSDPLLNLEPASNTTSNEIIHKSSSFIEQQEEDSENNDDTEMDQKIAKISNLIGNKKPPPIGGVSMFGGGVRPEDLKVPQLRKVKPETPLKSPNSSEDDLKKSKEKSEQIIQRRPSSSSESKVTPLHIDASGMPRPDSIATLGNQAIKTRPKTMGRRPPTRKTLAATAMLSNGEDSESASESATSTSKPVKEYIKSHSPSTVEELSERLGKIPLFTDQSDEEDLFKKRAQTNPDPKLSPKQEKKSTLFDESTSGEDESLGQELVKSPVHHVSRENDPIVEKKEESVKNPVLEQEKVVEPVKPVETKGDQSKSKGIFDDDSDDDEDLFKGKK